MSNVTPEMRKEAGNTAMIGIRLLFARYNPLISRQQYNSIVKELINQENISRDKSVFNATSEQIYRVLEVMRWRKRYSKKFNNEKLETNDLLAHFSELGIHRTFITEYIKTKRDKWGLKC